MRLRMMSGKDFPALMQLSRLFEYSPFQSDPLLQEIAGGTFEPALASDLIQLNSVPVLVAEEDNRVAGFCAGALNQPLSEHVGRGIASILLLSVDPDYRRRGFAGHLVKAMVQTLKSQGAEWITVGTDLPNRQAVRVYESAGFRYASAWHILRLYPGLVRGRMLNEIEVASLSSVKEFGSVMKRPVSLMKEKELESSIRDYLVLQREKRAETRKGNFLVLQEARDALGLMMIDRDETMERTLNRRLTCYRIHDLLFKTPELRKDRCGPMIEDMVARFGDDALYEFWLGAEDCEWLPIIQKAGFYLSYTGLSMHLRV